MNKIYPQNERVLSGNPGREHNIAFISTRCAKLILKKSLSGEWGITQIPAAHITGTFGITGFVPAFVSPTNMGVLFIKEKPGIFQPARRP